MSLVRISYIGLFLCLLSFKTFAQAPIVKTTGGYIRGVSENGVSVFKGVPYAQPPIGDLRYMPPATHTTWADTMNVSSFGAQSMQPTGSKASGSEDCLYLNIYTPAPDEGKRPVVVWVHGGSMTNGSGSGMNGHAFADRDGIVTITINYRLGALGFLYLGDIDKKYARSGNLGLLDVVAALKWIHENIAAFGGDPARVTIMGESAGAKLISAVMVAPASKGLYQQAILESGSVQCIRDTVTARNERSALLRQLGLDDPRQLLNIPADTLIRAQGKICAGIGGNSQFGPVYDGVTIPEDGYAATRHLSGIRVLMGTNEDEAALFISPNTDYSRVFTPLFRSNAPLPYAYYQRQLRTDSPYAAAVKTLTQYMYQMHAYRFAKALSNNGIPVWMYRFKYQGGRPFGARHSYELHYIWDADNSPLALNMHGAWVSFIKTGNPTPQWPRYVGTSKKVMVFDTTDTVISLPAVYDDPEFPSAVFIIK